MAVSVIEIKLFLMRTSEKRERERGRSCKQEKTPLHPYLYYSLRTPQGTTQAHLSHPNILGLFGFRSKAINTFTQVTNIQERNIKVLTQPTSGSAEISEKIF